MGSSNSSPGGSNSFNVATLMALLTVAGSVLVVSKKLTSDRPVEKVRPSPQDTIGVQKLEARLWEDPLKRPSDEPPGRSLERKTNAFLKSLRGMDRGHANPLLLPVMVPGGPYSEDREMRIRSRLAVVAALEEGGYAPMDAQHLGVLEMCWPNQLELPAWRTAAGLAESPTSLTNPPVPSLDLADPDHLAFPASGTLVLAGEWYRQRTFHPPVGSNAATEVLVLWLPEGLFGDDPALRLALFLRTLAGSNQVEQLFAGVKLIGPRTSETLRSLLPPYSSQEPAPVSAWSSNRGPCAVLKTVDLFIPTASAMDEVLVSARDYALPRQPVTDKLVRPIGFKSARSFCATDKQLAAQVLEELKLRQVDLADPRRNLVVISEWDTFYGRMLSLTYAAELASRQHAAYSNRHIAFVQDHQADWLTKVRAWPSNLHSFVYLRGLDGERTQDQGDRNPGRARGDTAGFSPADTARWNPEQNQAVGEAQLDYLTRLCRQLKEQERQLRLDHNQRLDAIGIVGGDIYDTLLILQALRADFPNALFFTTELDARLWAPEEEEWARNLLVVSSYGVRLRDDLQGRTAPFRDSGQTAVFAATLAALGHPDLQGVRSIAPRRFEIGRGRAVDLSVGEGDGLQPPAEGAQTRRSALSARLPRLALALLLLGTAASFLFRPLKRLTWERKEALAQRLWFGEEDLGGESGAERLLLEVNGSRSADPLIGWLREEFRKADLYHIEAVPADATDSFKYRVKVARMEQLLQALNGHLLQHVIPEEAVDRTTYLPETREKYLAMLRESRDAYLKQKSPATLWLNRRALNEAFDRLLPGLEEAAAHQPQPPLEALEAKAASHAREAALYGFALERSRQVGFWVAAALALGVGFVAWRLMERNAFEQAEGEPWQFFTGVSVWPTELIRLLGLGLALAFISHSYLSLRRLTCDLTRKYRLSFHRVGSAWNAFRWRRELAQWILRTSPAPQQVVNADEFWKDYQALGRFGRRLGRVLPPLVFYVLFGLLLVGLGGFPHVPARGPLAFRLDHLILGGCVLSFLWLTFWIVDAAQLCRWLIERISEAPTRYPTACVQYFRKLRGLPEKLTESPAGPAGTPGVEPAHRGASENPLARLGAGSQPPSEPPAAHGVTDKCGDLLGEWLDLHLVADVTERVGNMLYYPCIVFVVLLVSRHAWWDRWPWSSALVLIFGLNLVMALASVVIFQHAAQRAREAGLRRLRERIDRLGQQTKTSAQQAEAVGKRLVEDIENLRTGAFAPLWANPVLGAGLLAPGSAGLMELLGHIFR